MTGPTPEGPTRMLSGKGVVRIEWLPGTDVLLGTCHCGATHSAEDPISMWEWLLAHPDGHQPSGAPQPDPQPRVAVPV